jgi:starch phosphorylase
MAYLAVRGSLMTLAVSRVHGEVSRQLFQKPVYPRRPYCEVPVSHVTNGVHIPTWASAEAERLWTQAAGKDVWLSPPPGDEPPRTLDIPDEELWAMRSASRGDLVEFVRATVARQTGEPGREPESKPDVLDPDILTLVFAKRFTEYKRPTLLLRDRERLDKLLFDENRPIQIVIAGKAHPADAEGKAMIKEWVDLARQPRYRHRIAFIEDYDVEVARELVAGSDVWVNYPRRPWEACGTSGMKVLVNGGIGFSVTDGWWEEAYDPSVGWSIGGETGGLASLVDKRDATSLYDVLEHEIVPEFYDREAGLPRKWIARIRESMNRLTPKFGGARMMRDYVEKAYLPLARALRTRLAENFAEAKALDCWSRALDDGWHDLHIGDPDGNLRVTASGATWDLTVQVFLGNISPDAIRVELFADPPYPGGRAEVIELNRGRAINGTTNGYIYSGAIDMSRPPNHYTPRVVPCHPKARVPEEQPRITWPN